MSSEQEIIKLIEECKKGLNIPIETTALDGVLRQKLMAVKGYMVGAGVSEEKLDSDLAIGIIAMGVADLWELKSGEVKFSPAFKIMLSQLAMG
ncbi:hypothetical protein ACM26V_00425 [Salipaludibacillus sp. HK11]|uniref:hypothetical protein n=1 Tax=Salipaludibacillus sp. HK11 TaxID=3394320 RepID=UPI0039FDA6CE